MSSAGEGRTGSWWLVEVGLGLEVAALAAFAFSRPVLDSFGRSPETFIARRATTADIVLFGLLATLVPALVVAAVGAVTRVFGPEVRLRAHLALVAVLGGLGAWRMGRDLTGWPNDATKLLVAGALVGPLLGLVRWRFLTTATFLRYAGAASVVFLLQFLVMSPTSDVAFGGSAGIDAAVAREVAADLGDDPPPVVVVVLDALPTASLLDGTGRVDAELFPNIGALAATSTWYRNNTTVAAFTNEAVPALLTGRHPEDGGPPRDAGRENLFTLLGGSYDMHVAEQVTYMCPESLCPRAASQGLGTLLDDAVTWWKGSDSAAPAVPLVLPAALTDDRYRMAERAIEELDVSASGRPDFTFLHVLLPHSPWRFTEDGSLYDGEYPPVGDAIWSWSAAGADIGRQRHLLQLQAADRLVGQLMDRLRTSGVLDDSLVVLTSDHGVNFLHGQPARTLSRANIPYILWTPFFVKAPGQTVAEIDDGNVMSIDVLPTIADHLGIDVPWELDGIPAAGAGSGRDPDVKYFADSEYHFTHPADGETLIEIDGRDHFEEVLASDPVAATGADAIWRRTEHGDLFGSEVDGLRTGEPAGAELTLDRPTDLDDIDIDEPLPLEMIGSTDLALGTPVALALNGTIGAVTTVEDFDLGDGLLVHGLIPPRLFRDGANELTAFVIEGPPGGEVLRPVGVT